jgi:hypothetical protein
VSESTIQSEILGLSTGPIRLWRTNVGMGWAGKAIRQGSTVVIPNARPFHAMPEGWPDLTGFVSVTITPDMVGRTIAVFAAPEVKTARGAVRETQKSFREMFLSMGAIAGICRSVDDARKLLTP